MGRIGKFQLSVFALLLFIAQSVLAAGVVAGKVTIVKGQVFIVRGSEKIQVKVDTAVLESDVIESQPGGTARITMIDSNLVDVYPKSKVVIAKYVYKPNQDKKDVELKVDFGKIKSTVNQKYDGANNKFQVKTPSAVAGVRGTVFTAEYDAAKKISKVVTIEGLVAVNKIIDRERQAPPVFVRPDQVVKVDIEQASQEKPRDLKPEEREERKKEDKDLGYQYDPKKEATPNNNDASTTAPTKDQVKGTVKEVVKEVSVVKEPIKEVREIVVKEPVRDTTLVKEVEVKQPVKEVEIKQPIKEVIKEPVKDVLVVKEPVSTIDRNQAALLEEQAKKQKQLEEEQAKRQKLLEEEQAKKQKQIEEEQAKKQQLIEEEQAKKQKLLEEEQAKKQKQLEEELLKKQKLLEEEMRKREEELKKKAEEEAAKRAAEASRLAEIAKQAELANRLPSSTTNK